MINAISKDFGIPLRHVFPIVCYVGDREKISKGKNRLVIDALHQMIQLAKDYIVNHYNGIYVCLFIYFLQNE